MKSLIKIAPSILAADLCRLGDQVQEAERSGADWIHLDVMDGQFVPNISFGQPIVSAVKKCTKLPLDVHLMIKNPDPYIESFRSAGADIITIHQETCSHLYRTIQAIKEVGCKAGIALNPATPISLLSEVIREIDLILIMTVEPGFGGQEFIPTSLRKIQETSKMIKKVKKNIFLEVDGGIDQTTAPLVIKSGANVLVAGTSIFKNVPIQRAISSLRK